MIYILFPSTVLSKDYFFPQLSYSVNLTFPFSVCISHPLTLGYRFLSKGKELSSRYPLAICCLHVQEQVKAWTCKHARVKEWLYRAWFLALLSCIFYNLLLCFPFSFCTSYKFGPKLLSRIIAQLNNYIKSNEGVMVSLMYYFLICAPV